MVVIVRWHGNLSLSNLKGFQCDLFDSSGVFPDSIGLVRFNVLEVLANTRDWPPDLNFTHGVRSADPDVLAHWASTEARNGPDSAIYASLTGAVVHCDPDAGTICRTVAFYSLE